MIIEVLRDALLIEDDGALEDDEKTAYVEPVSSYEPDQPKIKHTVATTPTTKTPGTEAIETRKANAQIQLAIANQISGDKRNNENIHRVTLRKLIKEIIDQGTTLDIPHEDNDDKW